MLRVEGVMMSSGLDSRRAGTHGVHTSHSAQHGRDLAGVLVSPVLSLTDTHDSPFLSGPQYPFLYKKSTGVKEPQCSCSVVQGSVVKCP